MSKSDDEFYPPPGQQEPTNHINSVTGGQNPVQPQNQLATGKSHYVPPSQPAMPQQPMQTNQPQMQTNQPQMQYTQQPMQTNQPQMHYTQQPMQTNQPQQPMPQQQQYNQQQMPQQQYASQMPQQQYAPQMPQQQFYQQQMPQQQFHGQQPVNQQFPNPGQPMPGSMNTQSPAPFLSAQIQPWTTGLFDCAEDMENTIITLFFPCITVGQIAEITERGMSTCTSVGLIYGLLMFFTGFHWVYSAMYRTKLRLSYSLMEDPFHDFLVHCFCDPCALCQEYRELKNRGFNVQLGWAGNMHLQEQSASAASVPPPVQGMTR